jgi:hypothetical protein
MLTPISSLLTGTRYPGLWKTLLLSAGFAKKEGTKSSNANAGKTYWNVERLETGQSVRISAEFEKWVFCPLFSVEKSFRVQFSHHEHDYTCKNPPVPQHFLQ